MKKIAQALLTAGAFLLSAQTTHALGANSKIGTLECFVAGGSGILVGSSKDISCTLLSLEDEPVENYIGELIKIGLDVGFTKETVMQWSVYIPEFQSYEPGALSGKFRGASANASLAIGLGASILIGGLSENFALQPLKISKQKGVNIAVGITQMELRFIEDTEDDSDDQQESTND